MVALVVDSIPRGKAASMNTSFQWEDDLVVENLEDEQDNYTDWDWNGNGDSSEPSSIYFSSNFLATFLMLCSFLSNAAVFVISIVRYVLTLYIHFL